MGSADADRVRRGSNTMAKLIDVTLQQIACTAGSMNGPVKITADLFGRTFNTKLGDPNDVDERRDIPLPGGSISISAGHVVPITMPSVTFVIAAPSLGGGDKPKFLEIGGALSDPPVSRFFHIDSGTTLPFGPQAGGSDGQPPLPFQLEFSNAQLTIELTFGLIVSGFN
jgi:hypothetical protein